MYNVNTQEQLFTVPCGGGHRAWDFCYAMASSNQSLLSGYFNLIL